MDIIIVGGGVTGLTLAYHLADRGHAVTVLEKESSVGGLCRSYRYGDYTYDIGPHRLFSARAEITRYFETVLDGDYDSIPRQSQVYMEGKYLTWPLTPAGILRLPWWYPVRCAGDLLRMWRQPDAAITNLEEYITASYGPTIYETFWKGYTEKFLTLPCREVDAEWGRISVGRAVIDRRKEPRGLATLIRDVCTPHRSRLKFIYPRGGMGVFCDKLADRIRDRGGRIVTGANITALDIRGDRIVAFRTADGGAFTCDLAIWTGNLPDLCRLVNFPPPEVNYLSTMLFNMDLDFVPPGSWQWIYYPGPNCIFSRISLPARFGPGTAPEGRAGLCVEVTCMERSTSWREAERLMPRVVDDLLMVKLIDRPERITGCHVERVPNTYPIYRKGYNTRVGTAHAFLQKLGNLHLSGRQALFTHDNIDEAIENALQLLARLPHN